MDDTFSIGYKDTFPDKKKLVSRCWSHKCLSKGGKYATKCYVYKIGVPYSMTNCPDCGHVLEWRKISDFDKILQDKNGTGSSDIGRHGGRPEESPV